MHAASFLFAMNFLRWIASKAGDSPTLVFVGSISLITLIVFGWAILFHDHNSHRRHHRHHPEPSADEPEQENTRGWLSMLRGHRRRKRKKHRQANPTLAETGGLPEARDRDRHPPAPSA